MRQHKNTRRINAAKKKAKALGGMPAPKPEWIEAFLILLLHKTGGMLKVPIKSLQKFEQLKTNNKTIFSYDAINDAVVLMAPEIEMPLITVPKPKIITSPN